MQEGLKCRYNCCSHSVPLSSNWPTLKKKTPMVLCLNVFCAKNTNLQWCPAFQIDTECCDQTKKTIISQVKNGYSFQQRNKCSRCVTVCYTAPKNGAKNNLHITKPYYWCNSRARGNTIKIVVTQDLHLWRKGDTTCINVKQINHM